MPPKTQSTQVARNHFEQQQAKENPREKLEAALASNFAQFERLIVWLAAQPPQAAEDGTYRFVLPLPPNLLNWKGSSHWATKRHHKQQYHGFCEALRGARLVPVLPATPLLRPQMRVHFVVRQLMDNDNATARIKWPQDQLVAWGWIEDDNAAGVDWDGATSQEIGTPPRLEIILKEQE